MRSRFYIFPMLCTLIVYVGVRWIAAEQRTNGAVTEVQPRRPVAASFTTAVDTATGKLCVAPAGMALPAARAPFLLAISDLLEKQRRLTPVDRGTEDEIRCSLLALLTDDNAAAIVKTLSPENLLSEFGVSAFARWAETDVLAASFWLAQQSGPSDGQTWAVAQALVKDPVILEMWCERLPPGSWRETLLENATRASLPDNPIGSALLAQRLRPGDTRTRVLVAIADEWSLRDPAAALRWIATEPDIALRDELLFAGATALASTDPVAALEWTPRVTSDATMERTISKIASMWADYAPKRAQHFAVLNLASGKRPALFGDSPPP